MSRNLSRGLSVLALAALPLAGWAADGVAALKAFGQEVRSARASFTQVVTSPDGNRRKQSAGIFEFQRPNRFRFEYHRPYEQTIVADGSKVWLWDADLNQVMVRAFDQALGATPAAVLAGAAIERDFELRNEGSGADTAGLSWVIATPKASEGSIRLLRVGFKGSTLAALEITDAFGQRSRLDFSALDTHANLPAQRFQFTPPAGADVLKQ